MDDSEKIKEIKRIFECFHNEVDEYGDEIDCDTIDVCIKIERILEK